jgi:hypothetical protein
MAQRIPTAKKLVIGAVAAGTIALGTAGVVGADSTSTVPKAAHHFNCDRAPKVLTRIQAREARIAARLTKLTGAEAKAKQHGNIRRENLIKKRITRLEGPAFKARLDKESAAIEAKCHVSAPPTGSSAPTPATAGGSSGTSSTSA